MLQLALYLFLALGGNSSNETVVVEKQRNSINETVVVEKQRVDPLVKAVENTLGICSGIAGQMGNFSKKFRAEDARRREEGTNESLVDGVGSKMETCWKVYDAVKTGREEYCKGVNHDQVDQQDEVAISQLITFNVGGTLFTTNLTALNSVAKTRFERMMRGGMASANSADGTYFIDRSPRTFGYIMDYLRTGDLFVSNDEEVRFQLLDDAEYYELPKEVIDYLRWKPINGIDLWLSEVRYLNQELMLVRQKMGEVLYEAAQDGDTSGMFHSLCDNQGSNVVIIMTNTGNVFGGYSSVSWTSSSGYVASSTAFLFRLRPSIQRYNIKTTAYSIYRHSSFGPRFGNEDILLRNQALRQPSNYVSNAYYYGSGYSINNGVNNFKVQDYAVVKTIPL